MREALENKRDSDNLALLTRYEVIHFELYTHDNDNAPNDSITKPINRQMNLLAPVLSKTPMLP